MASAVVRYIPPGGEEQRGPNDASPDAPAPVEHGEQALPEAPQPKQLSDEEINKALLEVRMRYKESWSTQRQAIVRRVVKAIEYLKGNPYHILDDNLNATPLGQMLQGQLSPSNPNVYQFCDNLYQMLTFSYMAVMSNDVPKVRWMPNDPQEEADLSFSKQASSMMAMIERVNSLDVKAMLENMYFFVAGTYFSYTRTVVDGVRAGVTKTPRYEMRDTEVAPDRFVCPQCATQTPSAGLSPFGQNGCPECGTPLGQSQFYPSESMPMPIKSGMDEQPNSMTAIDVYTHTNVDVNPMAEELRDSAILDLQMEASVASVRASYPTMYKQISAGQYADGAINGESDRLGRDRVKSPRGAVGPMVDERGTYSRCWIHPWAFNSIDDQQTAQALTQMYPKGVKLVLFGADLVLEKVPESMLEHWTVARTVEGLGMAPPAVGEVALDIQDRLNNNTNNVELYQDSVAMPTVLANATLVDADSLAQGRLGGGSILPVYPASKSGAMRFSMQEALFQPTIRADSALFEYGPKLIQLAQLLTGVQPQVFGGGTTEGIDTATGQRQALNTALGRLQMFLKQCRRERALRAKLAVVCMARNIDGKQRITVEGDSPGQFENLWVLESEVQGEVDCHPEDDQGFPVSYEEQRQRIIELLGMAHQNPVVAQLFSEPDMQELVALYTLPAGAKLPGDSERTKIKLVLQTLAQQKPLLMDGVTIPSIRPDPDFDDPEMIKQIAVNWATRNYQLQYQNPQGFENVRAYFKLAAANAAKAQALPMAQAAIAHQAMGGQGQPPQLPPPGGQ